MNKCGERLYNGIIKENPTFVLMLGMCPTLAVTTTAVNGVGMGLSTTAVLVFSNLIISALRKIIPDRVRIPAYIVIVASLVTIVQLLLQAFIPSLYKSLGIYIPLIVVNCIILGRAEAYAAKNGVLESAFDGIGMGLGFTVGLTCIAIFREILGGGAVFGFEFIPEDYRITIFGLAPGAFFVLAILTALQNKFKAPSATNGSAPKSSLACGGNCAACSGGTCASNHAVLEDIRAKEEAKAAEAKKAAAIKAAQAKKEAEAKKAAEDKAADAKAEE
ncbi:MAG: electron transport complex subunit E [Lachnospiraceae bacterium]|jgi:electron transport complex protein RnfE|nr:electron transport complex subunit E [Lachnospiraceae bacterium]